MHKYFMDSVLERMNYENFFFYHMVPKNTDVSKGLLAPYAMKKLGMNVTLTKALEKYRNRLCDSDAWDIYPRKDPNSLTAQEILDGLNQYRKSKNGSKFIYFFKFPPTASLGSNMKAVLKGKDIYRINLNNKDLQKYILEISWGWINSNHDNQKVDRAWYENITPEKYFEPYDDNPKNNMLFAPLVHIGVAFKDGICPKKFITKISNESSKIVVESSKTDPNTYDTESKIKFKCEVKNSYHTLHGMIKDPIPQLILHKSGKQFRVRSEILVFKDDKILLRKKNKLTQYGTMYVVPGGGIDDPNEYIEHAAARECNEEARIVVSNVKFSGLTKTGLYGTKIPEWHKKTIWLDGIKYDGYFSYICTGVYAKKYTQYVKKVDAQADIEKQSHWYTYDEVKDILTPEHKKLFKEYLDKLQ